MKKLALVTALVLSTAGVALAQDAKATTDFRQGIFKVIGWDMGVLAGMAKGEVPFNADQAIKSATRMHNMANSLSEAFISGTYEGSRTKADVESKAEQFKTDLNNFIAESQTMITAAGAKETLGPQLGKLGGTCKACHDSFRAE